MFFSSVYDISIDEKDLKKDEARKLNALRKSLGDDLAEDVFAKWVKRQSDSYKKLRPDQVAEKLAAALATEAIRFVVHAARVLQASSLKRTKSSNRLSIRKNIGASVTSRRCIGATASICFHGPSPSSRKGISEG